MPSLQPLLQPFARIPLTEGATPIQRLARLESALGTGVQIYVKRDDLQGLGGGGNKLRKLEFLLGEALAQQADTIIAVGGRQSNFARLTAAACARLGLAWQDARIVSVHSKDAGEWRVGAEPGHGLYALAQSLRQHDRLLVLTSPDNTPGRIARLIVAEGLGDDFQMAVAERLCTPDERVVAELSPHDAAQQTFADPNVVVLVRSQVRPQPVRMGLADSAYHQRQPDKGLITKQEVRAVSLARMQLRADSRVWDIGAGSGSVGLEAARLCPQGHVWAIEKNEADHAIAGQNARAFGVSNHTLVHGKAPEGLDAWPDPDAVFIGGSGGELQELIALCLRRLRTGGWLVMNFVTLENLASATQALQAQGAVWDVLQLQAARSKPILHMHRMAAENPVWIVCAQRGEGSAMPAASAVQTAQGEAA